MFDDFVKKVQAKFLHFTFEIDKAEIESGSSWLDIFAGNEVITVEYRPNLGFGIHKGKSNDYGNGPDEVFRDENLIIARLEAILVAHKTDIRLKELQEMFGETHTASHETKVMPQPENFVKSHGGSLEIKAHFEECDVPISIGPTN
ncbi:MAG: hypothetical protein ABUK01_09665 [Leptospirales bacterium]